MTLLTTLEEFETAVRAFAPDFADSFGPPATDDEIEALRAKIAPCGLPPGVEELYRWHNGAETTVFAGRAFLSSAELVAVRGSRNWPMSPLWLPIFQDAGGGWLFVEGLDQGLADPYVWMNHKEFGPVFQYLDLEHFILTLQEALNRKLLVPVSFGEGRRVMHVADGVAYKRLTDELNPLPSGVRRSHSMFPQAGWTPRWLRSMGIDAAAVTATGAASRRFDDVIADARSHEVRATVTGEIVKCSSAPGRWWLTIAEGESRLFLETTPEIGAFDSPYPSLRIEADVVLGPDVVRSPDAPDEARFPGNPAQATAIRWFPPAEGWG